jgi:hypothetical protein
MQKSLTQMNLQIHHVISEITGVTGLAIVDAILAGERDPACWLNCVIIVSTPARRSFKNRWWVTGDQSICSR